MSFNEKQTPRTTAGLKLLRLLAKYGPMPFGQCFARCSLGVSREEFEAEIQRLEELGKLSIHEGRNAGSYYLHLTDSEVTRDRAETFQAQE